MELKISETKSSWSIGRLVCEVIKDRKTFIDWLRSRKLIPEKRYCRDGHEMHLIHIKLCTVYRCKRTTKHADGKVYQVSLLSGTILESALCPEKTMMSFLLFANNYSFVEALKEMTFFGETISRETPLRGYRLCRKLISRWMIENQADEKEKIGGHDRTVVIEVHKMEQCNVLGSNNLEYEEKWIIGVMERETNRYRVEFYHGEKPNDETLYAFIMTYVLPQTIIICDSEAVRSAFENCEDYYIYEIEEETVPPECRTMLQAVERSWHDRKRKGKDQGDPEHSAFGERYLEYIFRRKMTFEKIDPFDQLIEIIRLYYPVK